MLVLLKGVADEIRWDEKQTKNFPTQKLTIGLDLGDRSSWYCMLDEAGSVLLEQRVSTIPKALREGFGGMPRCRMALETGMHSPWVSRLLSELGHEVIVHGRVGDDLLVAKVEPHRAPVMGDEVRLVIEVDACHLFDTATEKRLGT